MTETLTPRKDEIAFRGIFIAFMKTSLNEQGLLFAEITVFALIILSEFSLALNTIAMPINRFNVVHASIFNGGFFGKFAFFLRLPGYTGTAAGHRTRHTIVNFYKFCTLPLIF
jgi:hypothetical protein